MLGGSLGRGRKRSRPQPACARGFRCGVTLAGHGAAPRAAGALARKSFLAASSGVWLLPCPSGGFQREKKKGEKKKGKKIPVPHTTSTTTSTCRGPKAGPCPTSNPELLPPPGGLVRMPAVLSPQRGRAAYLGVCSAGRPQASAPNAARRGPRGGGWASQGERGLRETAAAGGSVLEGAPHRARDTPHSTGPSDCGHRASWGRGMRASGGFLHPPEEEEEDGAAVFIHG